MARGRKRTLGIDPGNGCTGFAVLDERGKLAHHCTIRTSPQDGDETERQATIASRALSLAESYNMEIIGLEWQHFGGMGMGDSILKLAGLRGGIAVTLALAGFRIVQVQPKEAKKRLTGTGSADKKRMQAWVAQRHNVEVAQDVADAVGIAEHAQETVRLEGLQPELITEREN